MTGWLMNDNCISRRVASSENVTVSRHGLQEIFTRLIDGH
jgi:hypothetical protein